MSAGNTALQGLRGRDLIRYALAGTGVEICKVDQPVFAVNRTPAFLMGLTSETKQALTRRFDGLEHLRHAAVNEEWTTLYVYRLFGFSEDPIWVQGSVEPGPYLCRHMGLCSCLWKRGCACPTW